MDVSRTSRLETPGSPDATEIQRDEEAAVSIADSIHQDMDLVMRSAVAIWNLSLHYNRGSATCGAMIRNLEKVIHGWQVQVFVYDGKPENVIANYVLLYEDATFHLVNLCWDQPTTVWRLGRDYLESTLRNPQRYIDNPQSLDWGWTENCSCADGEHETLADRISGL